MKIKRRKTKVIDIGTVSIGGKHPVAIQSMAKTKTAHTQETIKQIKGLEKCGCEIVRVAVEDVSDVKALKKIKNNINIPLVADIHFDWRLAQGAINSGVDKIRLNPGNIYKKDQVHQIAKEAKLAHIPIRVGLNSGSLPKFKVHSSKFIDAPAAMVKGALDYIRILEKAGFYDIVVSLKATDIFDTVEAYRRMAKLCDYPFHLGVTATGPSFQGAITSAIALSVLLLEGIGDTMRVSLTDRPEEEVGAARHILEAIKLRCFGPKIISCPTCGRCSVDLIKIVREVQRRMSESVYLKHRPSPPAGRAGAIGHWPPPKVAIMGCVVNGPGEAREADVGVAFGGKDGLLFKHGKPLRKVSYKGCVDELLKEL